jgi:hypothetical protein
MSDEQFLGKEEAFGGKVAVDKKSIVGRSAVIIQMRPHFGRLCKLGAQLPAKSFPDFRFGGFLSDSLSPFHVWLWLAV